MFERLGRTMITGLFIALASAAMPAVYAADYPASYFTPQRPANAYEMIGLLPGFRFIEGDSDVRGLADSSGNVLIDGERPSGKLGTLQSLLSRIPAQSVSRIEVLRGDAPGIDMRGQPVVANVVRVQDTSLQGAIEAGSAFHARGIEAPRVSADVSRLTDHSRLELAAALYRTVDDEHGAGSVETQDLGDDSTRVIPHLQDEGDRVAEGSAGYQYAWSGAKLRLAGSVQQLRFRADIVEGFPEQPEALITEFNEATGREGSAQLEASLGERHGLDVLLVRRDVRERGGELGVEDGATDEYREDVDTSESILRAIVRRRGDRIALEAGGEIALNSLVQRSRLSSDGVEVPLPSADVEVSEERAEIFVQASGAFGALWKWEAGTRFEQSVLTLDADLEGRRRFDFVKPRVQLSGTNLAGGLGRFTVERDVGQLDFDDFASSASLSSDTISAGNPLLEPERLWRFEFAWERALPGDASVSFGARHEAISQLVDRVPVHAEGEWFDATGNLPRGERQEVELALNWPLTVLGLREATLQASALRRFSRTIDPATGEAREISEDLPFEGQLSYLQRLPRWNAKWGATFTAATREREFAFDEVRTDRLDARLDLYAEFEPRAGLSVRVFADNLTDRAATRERRKYDGLRVSGASPVEIETRTLRVGPFVGLLVRMTMGGAD